MLTSCYTLFITQTHLAGRCHVCYTLSNFIPAKRRDWRAAEDKVLYLLSAMTSGLSSVPTATKSGPLLSVPFSERWLVHFQGPNLCKQSLFSLSPKLISQMNVTFQCWGSDRRKKKSPAILMPAGAAWPYRRNEAMIQTQIEACAGEEHVGSKKNPNYDNHWIKSLTQLWFCTICSRIL